MKRKSTEPSGRAINPSRLMPTPSTTFRMHVVVDRRLIASQEIILQRSKSTCITTSRRQTKPQKKTCSSHPLLLQSMRWNLTAKLSERKETCKPKSIRIPQDDANH